MLLRDTIYEKVRQAILSCEFQPGQELRELELADRYHVSRSPIRDSLLRLEQEALVTVRPRQGYRVNPISISDAEELFGLRLLIEPACAVGAAVAGDTELRALDRFRGFADQNDADTRFIVYYESFHNAVTDLSGNKRMAAFAHNLIEQSERLVRVALDGFQREAILRNCAEHEAIIDALQAHDANGASHLSREHLEAGRERVMAALRLVACSREKNREPPTTAERTPHDEPTRGRGWHRQYRLTTTPIRG
ncbi:MAG: GntR family transcriptional regulator [Rhodopila sp.]|jgi:DNA-binding GntR family transcriptional regulator